MEDSGTMKRAEAEVKRLGLEMPKKFANSPEDLEWPSNVADLTPNELARHLAWWTGWASYIGPEVARAETNATAYQAKYAVNLGMEMHKRQGDFSKVAELKAAVSQLKHLQEIEMQALEAEAIRKVLKSLLVGYEKKYSTVSREITRREAEYERSKRG
jgi:hypothetical protein